MPAPLLEPPISLGATPPERPGGTHGKGDAVWIDADMPMHFHVFAYLVRGVLCKWWEDLLTTPGE